MLGCKRLSWLQDFVSMSSCILSFLADAGAAIIFASLLPDSQATEIFGAEQALRPLLR